MSAQSPPLAGVRVVDFSHQLMGPHGTSYLAWLGAEVVRVESRTHPDNLRARSKVRSADININKLSLSLRLQHPEAVRIARSLVGISDVVVENFSPGTMKKLGLGYSDLVLVKPDIIMVSASGFGQDGTESGYRSWAAMFAGMGGLSSLTGYRDGIPTALRLSVDTMCGQYWAAAVLAALFHRRRTGEGQYIDFAARDAIACLIGDTIAGYGMDGVVPEAKGNDDDWASPHNYYPCKGQDEWVSIAVFTDEEWRGLCGAMEKEELATDPKFREPLSRWSKRQELDEIVSSWTRARGAREVTERLQAVGVAAIPIMNSRELHNDPHLKARGFVREVRHPDMGSFLAFGPPWQLATSPIETKWAGPDVGEHTRYVLENLLGLKDSEISRLEKEGVLT